jgi:hypothetical protein
MIRLQKVSTARRSAALPSQHLCQADDQWKLSRPRDNGVAVTCDEREPLAASILANSRLDISHALCI